MRFKSGLKLYEVASMLSPSIYETVLHQQYKSRFDKETFVLDCDTFDKFYISENGYRNFINSNISKLGKFLDYFGFHQLYGSQIISSEYNESSLKITIEDKSIETLYNALLKSKSQNAKKIEFHLTFTFKGIKHFSHNELSEEEMLVKIEPKIKNTTYIQDQIIYVDKDITEIVMGVLRNDKAIKNIEYIIISFESIEIEDKAKAIWKEIFKNDYSTLYEYFINTRKSANVHSAEYLYENIIKDYDNFLQCLFD